MPTIDYQAKPLRVVGKPTIVTGRGRVVEQGRIGDGILIVDNETLRPILHVDEVSDEETINLFLSIVDDCAGILGSESEAAHLEILTQRHTQ